VANPRVARADYEALLAAGVEPPPSILEPLLVVLGASRALARGILAGGAEAIAYLAGALDRGLVTVPEHVQALELEIGADYGRADLPAILRRFKRREILRIGARDLAGRAPVDETMRELSSLAEAAVEIAVRHARARALAQFGAFASGERFRFVVLAMGKLGGGELNYSSDIDLVYLYRGGDGESAGGTKGPTDAGAVAARVSEIVTRTLGEMTEDGNVFRVDLRLRPEGQNGPIVNSFESALTYYESWGQTWERAAMLKARPVGGDLELGEEFLGEMEPFVYRRYLDFETIEEIQAMKARVDVAQKAERLARDVKLGPGGIREVEFVVQVLQLVHGGRDRRLRRRSTLETLAVASGVGLLERDEAERLAAAYRFLRDVEHKIQIDEERQTQLIPSDPDGERELASRLRIGRSASEPAAPRVEVSRFRTALDAHRGVVRRSFERIFRGARRSLDGESESEARKLFEAADDPAMAPQLRAIGFRDV
ncbi:MAG: bifunctional [glutamate--ammonia ligase]-adenylyl-L-tyrosine phosphorylase/[glutamate--ammonia-ligase] adenylyltransferase, partial [Candidatus Binatia bacterium]